MGLARTHHFYRNYKIGFKPRFLVNEVLGETPSSASSGNAESLAQQAKERQYLETQGYLSVQSPKGEALLKTVKSYNKIYPGRDRELTIHYYDRRPGYIDLKATLAGIDQFLRAEEGGVKEKDESIVLNIKESLNQELKRQQQGYMGSLETLDPTTIEHYRNILEESNLTAVEANRIKDGWNSKEVYLNLEKNYDEIVKSDPDLEHLNLDSQQRSDPFRGAENKALFMALMGNETQGFTEPLPEEEGMTAEEVLKSKLISFSQAVKSVDQGNEGGSGDSYSPAIRRLLIVRGYEENLASEGVEEDDTVAQAWISDQLRTSDFFNSNISAEQATENQKLALEVAFKGGEAAQSLQESSQELEDVQAAIKEGQSWGDFEESSLVSDYRYEVEPLQNEYEEPVDFLRAQEATLRQEINQLQAFLLNAQAVLQRPFDASGHPHPQLDRWELEGDGGLGLIKKGQIIDTKNRLSQIELNSKMLKTEAKNDVPAAFEKMGMNLNLIYEFYQAELEKNPDSNIKNWDQMLKGDPKKLAVILQNIIPPPTEPGGQENKAALLGILSTMADPTSDPKILRCREIVKARVENIKILIQENEKITVDNMQAMPKIEALLKEGTGIREGALNAYYTLKTKLFSGNPYDMALAAGAIYLIGSAVMGIINNKDKKWGKAGIAAMAATFAAAWYEDKSGNKVIDLIKKVGPNELEKEAEGTPELIMVNTGEKYMNRFPDKEKNIDRDAHLRGRLALRGVPYHKAMEWYQSTKITKPGYSKEREERLFNELGINNNEVVPGGQKREEKERRVKHILHETFAYSLEFVRTQNSGLSADQVEEMMEKTYIKPVKDKNFVPHHINLAVPEIYRVFHDRPHELTFGWVMRAHVGLHMFQQEVAKMKEPYGPVPPMVGKGYEATKEAASTMAQGAATLYKNAEEKVTSAVDSLSEDDLDDEE